DAQRHLRDDEVRIFAFGLVAGDDHEDASDKAATVRNAGSGAEFGLDALLAYGCARRDNLSQFVYRCLPPDGASGQSRRTAEQNPCQSNAFHKRLENRAQRGLATQNAERMRACAVRRDAFRARVEALAHPWS